MIMVGDEAPAPLVEAFRAYERALMANDLVALDALFAAGPSTLRGDAAGLLVGHDQISAFRSGRGGAPQRRLVKTHARMIGDGHALIVAVTELTGSTTGGRGQQTQIWARTPGLTPYDGWRVVAAHVSVPAPALDTRIWRIVGDPLIPSTSDAGPLSGESVAVKDLFAVAGHQIGAGNPEWLRHAPAARVTADAVAALLDAGAAVRGITRTDEFAYSLAGDNAHYGAPPNPQAPYRLPGGSSSGSATAVSLGHASIGLGTDTGGSIRVPAAYQGLFGLRTTHGHVSREGLLPLAPSFDTVGWLTRSVLLLRDVGDVLLPPAEPRSLEEVTAIPALLDLAESDVADAARRWLADRAPGAGSDPWGANDLDAWLAAFQTLQAYEAWASHGSWLETRLDTIGDDVRGRFERARDTTDAQAQAAQHVVDQARAEIRERIGERVWVLPAAASAAPLPMEAQQARQATLRLACLAGLGGLPALAVPVRTACGLPAGVCLLAAPGRDRDLLDLAVYLDSVGRQ